MLSKMEDQKPILKCESPMRWVILVLACLMLVGSYYCYDIPAAIKTQIDDYMGNPSDYEMQFGLLYTLYAAPNVILPFFGGYLVDRFGVRICLLSFASLIAAGQVIVSFGISIKSWPVIFLGRLVFGFGGESFSVANSALLADWFKGRELAFAFGVNLAIAKLGSVINNMVSPALAESAGIVFAFWFGSILCAASVFCVILTFPIDRGIEQRMGLQTKYTTITQTEENEVVVKDVNTEDDDAVAESSSNMVRDFFSLTHIFWVLVLSCVVVYGCVLPFNNISSSLLLERDYFKADSDGCALISAGCQSETNVPNAQCHTSKWYQPPLPYNVDVAGTFYDQVTAEDVDCTSNDWENGGCTSLYCSRLVDAEAQASVIMSIPYIISACLSPPLGFVIDRIGLRAIIATLAPLILVIVHMLLAVTDVNAIGPLVGQGLAYTGFVSVLWPSVPLVVEQKVTGLGFGIVTSMQNLGTALLPLIVAAIYTDSGDKYIPQVEFLFVILGVLGVLVGFYLNYYDYHHDSILNRGFAAAQAAERANEMNRTSEPLINPIHDEEDREDRVSDLRQRSVSREGRMVSTDRKRGPRGTSFTSYEEVLTKGGATYH